MAQLMRTLSLSRSGDAETDLALLARWIQRNGEDALLQAFQVRGSVGGFTVKPVASSDTQKHDQRALELMIKRIREKSSSDKAATQPLAQGAQGAGLANGYAAGPSSAGAAVQPAPPSPPVSPLAPPSPPRHIPSPTPPITPPERPLKSKTTSLPPAAPSPPPAPPSPPVRHSSASSSPAALPPELEKIPLHNPPPHRILPTGEYQGPPGYPFPWPPDLCPGPITPPPHIPPHELTWPHVERRKGSERRMARDRRNQVDLIFKNKRFGGDRRKGERRRGGPPQRKK